MRADARKMKFPFPTIDEAFLRAAKSCPQLTRELFLEQVLSHIADGSLRATGFLFWKKWRPVHIGHYGSDLGISEAFTSSERTEIPPLAMADYRPVFADSEIGEYRNEACQVVRGPRVIYEPHASYPKCQVVAITSIDGWTDVRFLDDIEKPWAVVPHKRGPAPKLFELIKTKMRSYDPTELANMKVVEMAATFKASPDTCLRARAAVLSSKK
jgi:hypothetical protein